MKPLIQDNERLVGAKTRWGSAIKTYDDGFGSLWIARNSLGIVGIVRAQTWGGAYGICENEFFPEADETLDEIVKEYGYRRRHVQIIRLPAEGIREAQFPADFPSGKLRPDASFVRWNTIETADPEAWMDNDLFQEAFGFRPNGPNSSDKQRHGIYSKDLNGEYLCQLTADLLAKLGVTLDVRPEA